MIFKRCSPSAPLSQFMVQMVQKNGARRPNEMPRPRSTGTSSNAPDPSAPQLVGRHLHVAHRHTHAQDLAWRQMTRRHRKRNSSPVEYLIVDSEYIGYGVCVCVCQSVRGKRLFLSSIMHVSCAFVKREKAIARGIKRSNSPYSRWLPLAEAFSDHRERTCTLAST